MTVENRPFFQPEEIKEVPHFARDYWKSRQELLELIRDPVYLGIGVPRGDGRNILVLGGWGGLKDYLKPMKNALSVAGYIPHDMGEIPNFGTPFSLFRGENLLLREFKRTGKPQIFVTHSMGGVLARMLAFMHPEKVAHIIAVATPFSEDENGNTHPATEMLMDCKKMADLWTHGNTSLPNRLSDPLPSHIGFDSLYFLGDPVVKTASCIDRNPPARNKLIHGSHMGGFWNKEVIRHIEGTILPNITR